jgi:hypothetical protein
VLFGNNISDLNLYFIYYLLFVVDIHKTTRYLVLIFRRSWKILCVSFLYHCQCTFENLPTNASIEKQWQKNMNLGWQILRVRKDWRVLHFSSHCIKKKNDKFFPRHPLWLEWGGFKGFSCIKWFLPLPHKVFIFYSQEIHAHFDKLWEAQRKMTSLPSTIL